MRRTIDYPGMKVNEITSSLDVHLENLSIRGYSILESVLPPDACARLAAKMDALNEAQIAHYGAGRLAALNESGVLRGMLADDAGFLALVRHEAIWPVIAATVGPTSILHLQNGIIVEPDTPHHQSAFHRDFAKDFVADKVLSINAFFVLDDFTPETGATWWVPHTHRMGSVPSLEYLNANAVQVSAPAGSVIFFDSLLVHRAGENRSAAPRRAINQQYTRPFIKQQMDYVSLLAGRIDAGSPLAQTLGFWSVPPRSTDEFRVDPHERTYRGGQG